MKLLFKLLIALVSIIVIIAIAFVVLINLTPRQLKLQDISIGDETIEEMGLADTKFIDIYKSLKSLTSVDEDEIVTNPYDSETEAVAAAENTEGSSIADAENYSSVATEPVTYAQRKLLTYNDTTIAYILNDIVSTYTGDDDALKFMKDANITVKELSITKDGDKGVIRAVCKMDLGSYVGDIKEAMGSAASILPIPDVIYIVSESSFTVNAESGKMETSSKEITINGDNDNPVTKAILKVVSTKLQDEGEDELTVDDVNDKIGSALSTIVYNLGGIGTATVDANNIITGEFAYSIAGLVEDHKLTLISHIAE